MGDHKEVAGTLVPALIVITIVVLGALTYPVAAEPEGGLNFKWIIISIDYDAILKHVEALASFESRVTGYEGSYEAAKYIYEYFKELGLANVTLQEYEVAVPIDHGAIIRVPELGISIEAYALWPNYIQTCRTRPGEPIKGRLVYVGRGDLSDLEGKDLEGVIAVMDFNSGDNWVKAFKLGARAVVFLEPPDTSFSEALSKFKIVPVYFPRVYVRGEAADKLLELSKRGVYAELEVDMRWELRKAYNVVAIVPGELPDESIIVAAHYDTWSVVPRLAPGADEAVSVAALMELARYFAQHKPRRTLWFVALSGHWQALAGAREFVEKYFFDPRVVSGEHKIWVFLGLDFSTDGSKPAVLYRGYMYNYGSPSVVSRWERWLSSFIFDTVIPALEEQTGRHYEVGDGIQGAAGWWASIPTQYMLDSEAFAAAHGLGITVRTDEVYRQHWGHPLSTIEYVNIKNLKPQLEVAAAIAYALANIEEIGINWRDAAPAKMLLGLGGADFSGFVTVKGEVLMFNFSRGWYSRVPNAIVVLVRNGHWYTPYPFSRIITIADDEGKFEVHGVWGFQIASTYVEAYKLDEDEVYIAYAPDYGLYGMRQIPFTYLLDQPFYNVTTVVFRASSMVLFDLIDPIRVAPKTLLDPRLKIAYLPYLTSTVWRSFPFSLEVYDFSTLSEYITWGMFAVGYEDLAMVFAPPRTRCMVIYRIGPDKMVLLNASEEYPEGRGFYMPERGEVVVYATTRRFALDMYYLSKSRYGRLSSLFLRNFFIEKFLKEAEESLKRAEQYFKQRKYRDAYALYIIAWNEISHTYSGVMSMIYDTLNVNLIFFVFLIPFSFFGGFLFFRGEGGRRAINIIALAVALSVVYYLVSPSAKVAQNFAMSPLSIFLEMLYIFIALLFLNEILRVIKEMRKKVVGLHFAERDVVSTAMIVFSYSIRNMRKYKLRTSLVLLTIVTVTFAMLSFTSIAMTPRLQPAPVEGVPTFNGVLLKYSYQNVPDCVIEPYFIDVLKHIVGPNASLAIRVWYYPISKEGKYVLMTLRSPEGRTYNVRAVLGLTPAEFKIHGKYIGVRGAPEQLVGRRAIIIPVEAARALQVDVGDEVYLGSYKLVVVGIYNSSVANLLKELDNYPFTPADPRLVQQLALSYVQQEERVPLSWSEIVVVPYELALEMGGVITSIAIPLSSQEEVNRVGEYIAYHFQGPLAYLSYGGKVYTIGFLGGFGFQGWSYFLGPLIIGSLTILTTILGGIKERLREIYVYTAVGLSPMGVTMLFIAESLVYALTAAVIGYLAGTVANIYLVATNMLPEGFIVNASSLAVAVSLAITLLASLLSSLYPALMASKLSVPSLERRWRMPTKPRGNKWEIPLPLSIPSYQETYGLLYYIYEYLKAHTVETAERFVVDELSIDPERVAVVTTMSLKPLESGTRQRAVISIRYLETENRYLFIINLELLHGARDVWMAANYHVVDALRKQMLLWRSLSEEERRMYVQKGLSVFRGEV
ncbi:MAG: hypothetical protein DRK00_05540 [Thermoprotei archaeon]|nr:MAG: hypothetical protein DRK00_05540 [Thermoprotei archaeon]